MTLELASEDEHATANEAAERLLLAAVLTGHPAAAEALDQVTSADFYQPRNAAVWEAMLASSAAGSRITMHGLRVPPQAQPYLLELFTNAAAEPMQTPRYVHAVLDAAQRRRLVEAAVRIRYLATTAIDATEATQDAARTIESVASATADADSGLGARDLLTETIDQLDKGTGRPALKTGWSDLDDHTGGMRPGELIIVGARPGYGKSVVAANVAAHAAKQGVGVHFASLEMRRFEVMNRLLAAQCGVNLSHLQDRNQMTERDWQQIADRSPDIGEWPLWIDDQSGQSAAQIRARVRATARRFELGLIIVDYLQIMGRPIGSGATPREQVVGDMAQSLKELAKEFDVPVLALAQVNRGPMDRKDPRPTVSDLRESGRIEADADQIWLLHRPDLVDRDITTSTLEIHAAKNRNGPSGRTVELAFFGHYSRAALMSWSPTGSLS